MIEHRKKNFSPTLLGTAFKSTLHRHALIQPEQNPKQQIDTMKENPLSKGMIEEASAGIGEISREMLAERAKELALIAARPVTREDRAQALSELTGEDKTDPGQAMLESVSEAERWAPILSSTGHQVEESASEEEDEDGHAESAQLFEEGVSEAAHDQMLQAAMTAQEKD